MMRLINSVCQRQRHLAERRDVIIVASVSCIYGLGSPVDYQEHGDLPAAGHGKGPG